MESLCSNRLECCKEKERAINTIKFDVEDSKVSEILQALLNSGVAVKNVEVSSTQHSKTAMVSELCSVEAS